MTDVPWQEQLRSQGLRVTPQRVAILRALGELSHPTPESILHHLQDEEPTLNLSTVYRTLTVLQEHGLITHAHLGSGSPAYHFANESPHLHLTCLQCRRTESIHATAADDFAARVLRDTGFTIHPTHAAIFGICRTCR